MPGKGKIENLRPPWKPGESGNPSGRPKKRPLSDLYAEFAERPVPEKLRRALGLAEGATFAEAQTLSLFLAASNGNIQAAREIREAIEGKAGPRPNPEHREVFELRMVYDPPLENEPEASPDTTPEDGPHTPQE
jgi:hypothetical protein